MRKFVFTLLTICLAMAGATAQPYVSDLGRFEVNQINGCAGLNITVTIRPGFTCNGGSPCDMDYEGNNNFQNLDFTHTYLQPGTYTLRVLFSGLVPAFDQITINVAPNVQPSIQVFSCTGNSSQLTVTDTNYDEYVINYNDGSPEVVVPQGPLARDSHTFPTAGSKLISVRGRNAGSDDNCNSRNWTLTAMPTLPTPTISQLQVIDASSIRLDFTNVQANLLYKLEVATNSNGFQPFRDVSNTSTQTITGLNTTSNYYCFRMGVFDPCSNTLIAYSNIICSADFDATAINSANRLVWRTNSTGVSTYSITRNPASTTTLSATPPQTALNDTDVVCNVAYCYQLTTLYANGSRSTSLSSCATAVSDLQPAATQNISIQVTSANSLDLHWTQDPLYTPAEYTVFKAGAELGKTAQPTLSDDLFLVNAGACYTVSYVDACGNQSAMSASACPIVLSAVLQPDNSVVLNWNAFDGWVNGVAFYTLHRETSNGQMISYLDVGTATTFTDTESDLDNQVIHYFIVATPAGNDVLESSISNEVVIIKQPNLYHPNTFTPNSDGLNDTFQVMSQYTSTVEFMVFNRWGEMLFYTTDLAVAWDGTYKGNAVPEGTYVFRAFLTDMSGTKYERSGNVLLLRKR